MLKRFTGLDFLCKPTANQNCCTSSHNCSDSVLNAVWGCVKRAEVTTLCCGWTAWVIAFERNRFEVKRIIIRGVNLNFSSHFGFCELTELILNTKSGLHSQFTKETQHKVKKSKIQRISANNKLYSKSLKPQVVERLGDKFLLSKQRRNKMDFFDNAKSDMSEAPCRPW